MIIWKKIINIWLNIFKHCNISVGTIDEETAKAGFDEEMKKNITTFQSVYLLDIPEYEREFANAGFKIENLSYLDLSKSVTKVPESLLSDGREFIICVAKKPTVWISKMKNEIGKLLPPKS